MEMPGLEGQASSSLDGLNVINQNFSTFDEMMDAAKALQIDREEGLVDFLEKAVSENKGEDGQLCSRALSNVCRLVDKQTL